MANPAPTINQINAFNATQGTIIDFNIIGGTELVRSNRIYIYDLSDNSLICTHLYVSTESIHELPANTDSSIVYESGKSSADFVNGAQYYAQIQTYTDTAGTEGGSGLSVAKMFWCLVDPTLTITTIPSTISTTSYNVSATYNANTSVVSNIIQQYQFSLYSATGSLLQSSGVVVGSGTQQGTSTAYDISYNFTGLSVGSSYYVTVNVTTTQGMSVSVQSNTFTVSIDTPTLGEATVVNNACDGYISVTSNLSSEYGGSGSGEIVSFETDSENVFTKLQVDLDPIQDLHGYDKPWVGGAGVNKWDEVTYSNGTRLIGTNSIPLVAGQTYYVSAPIAVYIYANGSNLFAGKNNTFTVPSGVTEGQIQFDASYGLVYNHDVSINYPATITSYRPYSNICPISGHTEVDVSISPYEQTEKHTITGKNLFNAPNNYAGYLVACHIDADQPFVVSASISCGIRYYDANKTQIDYWSSLPNTHGDRHYRVLTVNQAIEYVEFYGSGNPTDLMVELGNTPSDYEPYGHSYTTTLPSTTYGGTLDLVSGVLTVDRKYISLPTSGWSANSISATNAFFQYTLSDAISVASNNDDQVRVISDALKGATSHDVIGALSGFYSIAIITNKRLFVYVPSATFPDVNSFMTWLQTQDIHIVYELATPLTYQLTPQQIQTLVGVNNVWSEQGDVELSYHIPITNLLVKRQDVDDVSGNWLTLYSQPITQASDMNFTFIDFTNQYGKTYKYALVPLLTQQQSGVEVEVEGGYTVSDEVQSIFDGVFIADQTGLQKCKANVGYGDVDMNQAVGTITPIGSKYPVVITNSKNQYHNGSISGTIVPDDYYFNGNLSRIDMVNKRNELEQFLTNKRAKIIKDWNSNIWLVMIMDNINCTFNNEYGMGIVNFTANWIEVGDPTNQQDLQATGLIDVGGV